VLIVAVDLCVEKEMDELLKGWLLVHGASLPPAHPAERERAQKLMQTFYVLAFSSVVGKSDKSECPAR